jgi:hypothetical protein
VFFIEAGTLNIWYLAHEAIGGPARPIYCGPKCRLGGELIALASMTTDGGKGADQLVAVTDRGELLVYNGSNPDNAASWTFAGAFTVSIPVGRRCFASMGGAIALLTVDGLFSVPAVLSAPDAAKESSSLSRNIDSDLGATGATVIESGSNDLTMVSVGAVQWVRDSETNGWSRLLGLPATCWIEGFDGLYFGTSDGTVCRLEGFDDPDAGINTVMVDSFSKMGTATDKVFKRVLPHFHVANPYIPRIEVVTNYRAAPSSWIAARTVSKYWMWDEISWPMQPEEWIRSQPSHRRGQWRGLSGKGHTAAMIMGTRSFDHPVKFIGASYAYEAGGAL